MSSPASRRQRAGYRRFTALRHALRAGPVSFRGIRLVLRRAVAEAWDDRILGLSAEAGFWQLLSLPPLVLAVLGTIGFFRPEIGGANLARMEQQVLDVTRHVFAGDVVNSVVAPTVHQVLSNGRADVVSIGFVLSLWTGSSATATYVNTITIAYGMRGQRGALRSRLLAFGLYLLGVVAAVVMLPLLVIGPDLLTSWIPQFQSLVAGLYWPLLLLVGLLGIATLYHLAVPVRTRWRRDLPGALVAMLLWVGGSVGLREYLTQYAQRASVYGRLGAVVAVLLFLYVTALAVLFGAELNAEIDKLWPTPGTAQARRREHERLRADFERRERDLEWLRSERHAAGPETEPMPVTSADSTRVNPPPAAPVSHEQPTTARRWGGPPQ